MRGLIVKLTCYLLKLPLNIEQRTQLVGAILDANNAVPLFDIITEGHEGNGIMLGGVQLPSDAARGLRESARTLLNNPARRYVIEQVASIAGRRGISQATKPEDLIFYRAALWWGGQELAIYKALAETAIVEE